MTWRGPEKAPDEAKKSDKADPPSAEGKAKAKKAPVPKVRIDLEDIGQRVVALPLPARFVRLPAA